MKPDKGGINVICSVLVVSLYFKVGNFKIKRNDTNILKVIKGVDIKKKRNNRKNKNMNPRIVKNK